jgi:hypothetical protein
MKDLKNLFKDEDEARELLNCYMRYFQDGSFNIDATVNNLKKSGIIRKSALEDAREKTNELMITLRDNALESEEFRDLKQLIQAERQAADKKE